MDWLTQLFSSMQPGGAMAQGAMGTGMGDPYGASDPFAPVAPVSPMPQPAVPAPITPAPVAPVAAAPQPVPTPVPSGTPGDGSEDMSLGTALSPTPGGAVAASHGAAPPQDRTARVIAALQQMSRGVQAPKPVDNVLKPSTPAAPGQPRGIGSAPGLLEYIQHLGNARAQMMAPMRARTLGDALGTGRY